MKGIFMFIIWILIIIAGVYVAFAGFLFIFQSSFLYYPERTLSTDPGNIGLSFENVSFETTDRVKLYGWYVPCDGARGVILFCYGNAGNISHRLDSIQIFHRLGLGVFIFDYRGYGRSEEKPSESGTYRDVEAAWQYLIEEQQVLHDKIIIFGRSLGGAVAAWQAHSHTPGALILESTFTSVPHLAAEVYPFLPVKLISRFKYDTEGYLEEVNCPVLIVHSPDDEMMPYRHGQRLFETAKEPKEFLEIRGSHNEGFITSGKRYEEGLNTFISEYLPLNGSN
ncbi:alpha/beta hydrolase [Chloroflexota bacterium]